MTGRDVPASHPDFRGRVCGWCGTILACFIVQPGPNGLEDRHAVRVIVDTCADCKEKRKAAAS